MHRQTGRGDDFNKQRRFLTGGTLAENPSWHSPFKQAWGRSQEAGVPPFEKMAKEKTEKTAMNMETPLKISSLEFHRNFKHTGTHKHAIFTGRKPLMEEIYATGIPIYCDQSYYVQHQELDLVRKVGDHFECDDYKHFEEWRDCQYYSLWEDAQGNRIWLMTGGRYD